MCVFSKSISGNFLIEKFDVTSKHDNKLQAKIQRNLLLEDENNLVKKENLSKDVNDLSLVCSNISVVHPNHYNLHSISSLEDGILLDLIFG